MSELLKTAHSVNRKNMVEALMEAIVDGIITIDSKGIIHSLNPATERIFGYKKEELIGQNVKVLMPEPYQSEHDQYLKNFHQTGQKKIIGIGREVLGRRKNGEVFPLELAVNDMLVDDRPMFAGIVRDISDRKAVFDQLALQGGALEAAANAIVITDTNGDIQWVNTAFTDLTGYVADEVVGKSTRILKSGKQSQAFYRELWQTVKEGRVWQGEIINKRKDGTLYTEEQTITPVVDGEGRVTHFIAIKLDISERKRAEEVLAGKNRELETIAEFERTQSKVIALFNSLKESRDIFSRTLEILADAHQFLVSGVYLVDEWQGKLNCIASHGLPKSMSKQYSIGEDLVGQAAQSNKMRLITAPDDGHFKIDTGLFCIEPRTVIITPIIHADKVLGVIVLASLNDLEQSEQSFIERLTKQIALSLNSLLQYQHLKAMSEQLKQRGAEISQKNEQLEQSNKLKTEFLANMSHELRTPLNAIIGFSEVLRDELLGELNEEQKDYVSEVFTSANHLLSLINDILDLSKIEAGKMELKLELDDLPSTLKNAVSIVRERAHQHDISINIDIDAEIGFARVDSRKIKQILFNLLSNAVKFTPDGGEVTLKARRIDNHLEVSVIDTGIGIAPEKVDLLFQPFVQLDGSLARYYEGTGLGLAMVKRLVNLLEGTIELTSEVGKGSCFKFVIPYLEPELLGISESQSSTKPTADADVGVKQPARISEIKDSTDTENDSQNSSPSGASARCEDNAKTTRSKPLILIIENDASQANLLKLYTQDMGFRVLVATGAEHGLELMQQETPDLITIDLLLAESENVNFLEMKQSLPDYASIPVMVLSTSNSSQNFSAITADAVLNKPIQRTKLMELVTALVDSKNRQPSEAIKILLIDDDPKAIKIIESFLVDTNFKLISALSGRDGLELIALSKPDLIILDLMMPEMNGFEVLHHIKSSEKAANLPVVILTAKLLSDSERKFLKEQATCIFQKGTTSRESLLSEFNKVLTRYYQ